MTRNKIWWRLRKKLWEHQYEDLEIKIGRNIENNDDNNTIDSIGGNIKNNDDNNTIASLGGNIDENIDDNSNPDKTNLSLSSSSCYSGKSSWRWFFIDYQVTLMDSDNVDTNSNKVGSNNISLWGDNSNNVNQVGNKGNLICNNNKNNDTIMGQNNLTTVCKDDDDTLVDHNLMRVMLNQGSKFDSLGSVLVKKETNVMSTSTNTYFGIDNDNGIKIEYIKIKTNNLEWSKLNRDVQCYKEVTRSKNSSKVFRIYYG